MTDREEKLLKFVKARWTCTAKKAGSCLGMTLNEVIVTAKRLEASDKIKVKIGKGNALLSMFPISRIPSE